MFESAYYEEIVFIGEGAEAMPKRSRPLIRNAHGIWVPIELAPGGPLKALLACPDFLYVGREQNPYVPFTWLRKEYSSLPEYKRLFDKFESTLAAKRH